MTDRFDLTALGKPVAVLAPTAGEVFVDLHGEFRAWLAKGIDQDRWADGQALIRAILAEQARTRDKAPLAPEMVASLDDDQLGAFAVALLTVGGATFQPSWIRREGAGRRPRARRRRTGESYDLSAREEETELMRFYRIARDLREDLKLRDAEIAAQIFGPNHDEFRAVSRQLKEFDRMARAANLADTHRTGLEIAKASAARSAALAMKGADLTAAQGAIRAPDLSSLTAAAEALQTLGRAALVAAQGMGGAVSPGRPNSVGVEVERLLSSNLAAFQAMSQVMGEQSRAIQAALALTRGPDGSSIAKAFGGLTLPRNYFEALDRRLHVPNLAASLAALAAVQTAALTPSDLQDALARVAALRPGYQMTAALGLTGAAPRGVAADVLRAYETEPGPATPVFGAALRTAHLADIAETGAEEVEELWATIRNLRAQVRKEPDPVRRFGLFQIINFIVTIAALLLGAASMYGDHLGRVADQADREEQSRFQEEVRRDQSTARREAAERYRTTRYIAADGPLRAEPHAQGPILQFVYTGQLAIAKDQRDGWVQVEVFNYGSEQPVVGWLPARRLRVGR